MASSPDAYGTDVIAPNPDAAGTPVVGDHGLSPQDATLVLRSVHELVASTAGAMAGPTPGSVQVRLGRVHDVRAGLRMVAATVIATGAVERPEQGRPTPDVHAADLPLSGVFARRVSVALLDGPAGRVPLAWWAPQPPPTPTLATLEAVPLDDPAVAEAVGDALREAGFDAPRVLAVGALPGLGLLIVEADAAAPSFTHRDFHRVLLDANDLKVIDNPWGNQ